MQNQQLTGTIYKNITMIKLIDLLNEGKQVGTLYHFTSLSGGENIIKSNILKPINYDFISLTRDKNLYKTSDHIEGGLVRLTLDGDKLSNNFKIKPYDEDQRKIYGSFESEERIDKPIKNIKDYITKIDIILDFYKYVNRNYPELLFYEPQEIKNAVSIFKSSGIPFNILLKNNKVDLKTWLKISKDFIQDNKNEFNDF